MFEVILLKIILIFYQVLGVLAMLCDSLNNLIIILSTVYTVNCGTYIFLNIRSKAD